MAAEPDRRCARLTWYRPRTCHPDGPPPAAGPFEFRHRLSRRQRREQTARLRELGGVHLARHDLQHRGFLRDVRRAVARIGVAAQPLRPAAARFLLNRLEHAAEIARVVARTRHDLRAQQVGLLFVLAAVLEEHRAEAELAAFGDELSPSAADHRAGDRPCQLAELEALRLGRVGGAVAQQRRGSTRAP